MHICTDSRIDLNARVCIYIYIYIHNIYVRMGACVYAHIHRLHYKLART